jgi:hypothetical protein
MLKIRLEGAENISRVERNMCIWVSASSAVETCFSFGRVGLHYLTNLMCKLGYPTQSGEIAFQSMIGMPGAPKIIELCY